MCTAISLDQPARQCRRIRSDQTSHASSRTTEYTTPAAAEAAAEAAPPAALHTRYHPPSLEPVDTGQVRLNSPGALGAIPRCHPCASPLPAPSSIQPRSAASGEHRPALQGLPRPARPASRPRPTAPKLDRRHFALGSLLPYTIADVPAGNRTFSQPQPGSCYSTSPPQSRFRSQTSPLNSGVEDRLRCLRMQHEIPSTSTTP